jgi:hypothetical protein
LKEAGKEKIVSDKNFATFNQRNDWPEGSGR